jgi:hypothetical protein
MGTVLRIDDATKRLVPPSASTLRTEDLRERADLQELIVNSWEVFASELGLPGLRYLGKEVQPHASCANRIDILAFDEDEGRPVVIELKRDRDRMQLLQGLSYAGMIATWRDAQYSAVLAPHDDADLRNSVEQRLADVSPAVVLIAEEFDPEVILTANWLRSQHQVDIACYSLKLLRFGESLHLAAQRDFPPKGIDEVYRTRSRLGSTSAAVEQSWEDVQEWVSSAWLAGAIDRCLATGSKNDAKRRYFATPFNTGVWGGYMFYVNKREAKVRFHGRRDGDVAYWESVIPGARVSTWGNENTQEGIAVPLATADALDRFVRGLGALPTVQAEPNGPGRRADA